MIQKSLKCLVSNGKYESKCLCLLLHQWLAKYFTLQQCEYEFAQTISVERDFKQCFFF